MHVEVRLVVNMRLQRENQPPRLDFRPVDFCNEYGKPRAVIYLGLNQAFIGEHYSTLEEDLQADNPRPPATPDELLSRSDTTDLYQTVGEYIRVGGEEYSMSELEAGVPCGDNQHKYILEREGHDFVISKLDKHSGARDPVRRIPIKTSSGQLKEEILVKDEAQPMARRKEAAKAPVRIGEQDVKNWTARLARADGGVQATGAVAQELLDAILRYCDHLELTSSTGTTYMDGLGERMHRHAEAAKQIKRRAHFEAHSEGQQCFKVMAIGVEGSGKSTTLNSIQKSNMQDDAALAAKHAGPIRTEQHFTPLFTGEFGTNGSLDDESIVNADRELEAQLSDKIGPYRKELKCMNKLKDDFLITGAGRGSLTALPTFVELDPELTVGRLTLTYRARHFVDDVLNTAAMIRQATPAAPHAPWRWAGPCQHLHAHHFEPVGTAISPKIRKISRSSHMPPVRCLTSQQLAVTRSTESARTRGSSSCPSTDTSCSAVCARSQSRHRRGPGY